MRGKRREGIRKEMREDGNGERKQGDRKTERRTFGRRNKTGREDSKGQQRRTRSEKTE